jgi:hypothetical protein
VHLRSSQKKRLFLSRNNIRGAFAPPGPPYTPPLYTRGGSTVGRRRIHVIGSWHVT